MPDSNSAVNTSYNTKTIQITVPIAELEVDGFASQNRARQVHGRISAQAGDALARIKEGLLKNDLRLENKTPVVHPIDVARWLFERCAEEIENANPVSTV